MFTYMCVVKGHKTMFIRKRKKNFDLLKKKSFTRKVAKYEWFFFHNLMQHFVVVQCAWSMQHYITCKRWVASSLSSSLLIMIIGHHQMLITLGKKHLVSIEYKLFFFVDNIIVLCLVGLAGEKRKHKTELIHPL